jgi:hypothetical protein
MLDALPAYLRDQVEHAKLEARNTLRAVMRDGTIIWRYHDTTVFTRLSDDSVYLNTGGWNTRTTRDRINAALSRDMPKTPFGFGVHTERGTLYLSRWKNGSGERKSWPFSRSIEIGPRGGSIVSDLAESKMRRDMRLIGRYMKAWKAKDWATMADASAGDPWVFPDAQGKVCEHAVRGWLEERYCFAKLAIWALEFSGRTNLMFLPPRDMIDRAVRRYLRACLGYASS